MSSQFGPGLLIVCLSTSVKRRLTDAGPSATFSCFFTFLRQNRLQDSIHSIFLGEGGGRKGLGGRGGGHHIYLTVSLAGCFPFRRFLSLADSCHQRLPSWGPARTAVGGDVGRGRQAFYGINNSKLQKSGHKKRRHAFKVQLKGSLFLLC